MTMMEMEGYCELARDARISLLPDRGHAPSSGCRRDIGSEGIALMQVPERREKILLPAPANGAHDKAWLAGNRIHALHQCEIAAQGGMQQCLKIGSVMIGYRHDTSP